MMPTAGSREPYDFVFAGGGLAGLSLARALVGGPFPEARILLIDKEPKQKNDRTWCYWSRRPEAFDSLAVHTWPTLLFSHPAAALRIPLNEYRYRMIRGIDFYNSAAGELRARPTVEFFYGGIRSIRDGSDAAEVEAGDEIFRGRWVFNSLFRPGEFVPGAGRYTFLNQHFLGWDVEAERDAFDPGAFTMFDFRTPQRGAMRFFYVLPASPRRALVEYTLFSEKVLAEEEYRAALEAYLRDELHLERYQIRSTEFGVIPMTDFPFPRRLGKRILAIGTRGGRVKPTTGFAFRRIQKDTASIVRSLEHHGDPFHLPADPALHRLYDSTMLRIMKGSPEHMADIFLRMFGRNPIERVFAFLDEEIDAAETVRLFATMPLAEFSLALLGLAK